MADLTERLEKMEAYIKVLNDDKMDSRMQIKLLETRLVKSEQRIQELEQGQEKLKEEAKSGFKMSEFKKMDRRLSDVERQQLQLQEKIQEKSNEEVRCGFKKGEFKKMKQRIAHLERQQQQLQEQTQDASQKFERIGTLQHVLNSIVLKRQQTDPTDLRRSHGLATQDEDSQSNETYIKDRFQKISEDLENVKDQVEENKTAIHRIRSNKDTMVKSAFRVQLTQGTELNTQNPTHLDQCIDVFQTSPCFDKGTSYYTTPTDGTYQFNVTVCQKGCGELLVFVETKGGVRQIVAGPYINDQWKGYTNDVHSGSGTFRLSKDQRVGVYSRRYSGQAEVLWCTFSGCLVSPST